MLLSKSKLRLHTCSNPGSKTFKEGLKMWTLIESKWVSLLSKWNKLNRGWGSCVYRDGKPILILNY